jgi:hypothetical protein
MHEVGQCVTAPYTGPSVRTLEDSVLLNGYAMNHAWIGAVVP